MKSILNKVSRKLLGIPAILMLVVNTFVIPALPAHAASNNIFSSTDTPAVAVSGDSGAVELGVKFTSDTPGTVTGVRFYKGDATNAGTHYGHLWTTSGSQLAEAQFTSETTSGWQDVTFTTPVNINANTTYVASYYAPQGHYSYTSNGFSTSFDNAPLHAPSSSTTTNGLYQYTSAVGGGFPSGSYNATNYWVDVDFTPGSASSGGSSSFDNIWSNQASPAVFDGSDSNAVELGVKFTSDTNGQINGVRFFKGGSTNGGTHYGHLWSTDGTQLGQAQFTNETSSGWQDATFTTPVNVTAGTTYVASYYAPQGHYSYTSGGLSAPVDNAPLHTIANSVSANGVYLYTANQTGNFPTNTYGATNYWVDVDFTPAAPATIWPSSATPTNADSNDPYSVSVGVKFQSDTAGYISGVRFYKGSSYNSGTHIGQLWSSTGSLLAQATFTNETGTGWQDVKFNGSVPVSANTTYTASYFAPVGHYSYDAGTNLGGLATAVNNPPLHALASSASGGNGVYSYGSSPVWPNSTYNSTNYWVDVDFTTYYQAPTSTPQATPRSGIRGSGPLLVLTDPTNAFSDDYCSALLKTEGIPECAATDTGNLTSSFDLSGYRTIILTDGVVLTSSQLSQISAWTSAGGTFIAMKPADNLDSFLGIGTKTQGPLFDAYFGVNASAFPGIETQTMQYHGAADQHPLSGAGATATLYSNATTATSYPAVTTSTVGAGKAIAFMFDLAKSVVYTRNGNPGLAGQSTVSTDNQDRFVDRFGKGWLDVSKASIPQADEQQHMLVNLIETSSSVPKLWYFPSYQGGVTKAALVLTGDDHAGSSQTLSRFAAETTASPAGCSVADWTCYTSTSYAYAGAFSDASAKPYTDNGFEVSPHIASSGACASNWKTTAQLDAIVTSDINAWDTSYPSISSAYAPLTERFHCYGMWNDYASIPTVEAAHGITADTNSACWPNAFLNVSQCLFTGSGIPEQYTDPSGDATGVQQFTTQATDENPSTTTLSAINGLVTAATGSTGYYGYFTILCHLDNLSASNQCASDTLNVAQSNTIPMVSARQAQTFFAARNASTITNLTYAANSLTFTLGTSAHNLQLMVPSTYHGQSLSTATIGGQAVSTISFTASGVNYAIINVPSGTSAVVATY